MDDKAYPPVDTQALLDALPDPTAVVDAAGTLVLVNAAWSASGGHGYFGATGRPGDDYLELCERGWSDDTAPARVVARGLRAVLAGQRAEFAHEYLAGELGEQRWYRARAARLPDTGPVRALVSHASFDGDKQIDARARLSELTHRTLVEHLPLVIYIYALEPASHTLYVSPQIEAMLGFEQAEWMADPGLWLRQVHPDDRATMEANLERSRAAGASILSEYRMLARDGRVVWVRYEAAIVRDKAGRPLFVRGIAQDITARKQAEEDLRDREARLRLLAEQLPAVVWSTDTALRFTSGQGRGLLALDIRPEEPIGRVLMDYQGSPEAAAIALAAHQRALQGEAVSYELETRGRVFQAHVAPARDAAGAIVGVIGVAIDITLSKELRAALTANQLRLQALFDNAEDAFLLFDD